MDNSLGEKLIEELLADPVRFAEKGRANKLLDEYFRGFPLRTLRPLLTNNNRTVQYEAVWIVSELGRQGSSLIFDIIPFLKNSDRSIRYEALESVMVFSEGENFGEFLHVVKSMQSDDEVIRVLAMYLVSNANNMQLQSVIQLLGTRLL